MKRKVSENCLIRVFRCTSCLFESETTQIFLENDAQNAKCPRCGTSLNYTPTVYDTNGVQITVGSTVSYGVGTSTVTVITTKTGNPFAKITLANGLIYNAYMVEVVK